MFKTLWLILLIALLITIANHTLPHYFSLDLLKKHLNELQYFAHHSFILASASYIALYIITTALSIPVATLLTLTAGLLFPQPYATLYPVIGASIGASLIFKLAFYLQDKVQNPKVIPTVEKLKKGLHQHPFYYLLFIRLIPLFPFWLVNILPGLLAIPFKSFFIATFLGIIPGCFVYAQGGVALRGLIHQQSALPDFWTWESKLALVTLAFLALLPPILKKRAKIAKK